MLKTSDCSDIDSASAPHSFPCYLMISLAIFWNLMETQVAGANDDCENVVIDENDTDDESILVETV